MEAVNASNEVVTIFLRVLFQSTRLYLNQNDVIYGNLDTITLYRKIRSITVKIFKLPYSLLSNIWI